MIKTNRQQQYSAVQEFHMIIPYQFLLLCRLLEVTPQNVLYDFMCNAGHEFYGGKQEQKVKAMEYLISCRYGQQIYEEDDIRMLFKELESIGNLWPGSEHKRFMGIHRRWCNKYYLFFYNKWYRKCRRKQS